MYQQHDSPTTVVSNGYSRSILNSNLELSSLKEEHDHIILWQAHKLMFINHSEGSWKTVQSELIVALLSDRMYTILDRTHDFRYVAKFDSLDSKTDVESCCAPNEYINSIEKVTCRLKEQNVVEKVRCVIRTVQAWILKMVHICRPVGFLKLCGRKILFHFMLEASFISSPTKYQSHTRSNFWVLIFCIDPYFCRCNLRRLLMSAKKIISQ